MLYRRVSVLGLVLVTILTFAASASTAKTRAAKRHAAHRPTPSEPTNVVAMAGPTLGSRELLTNKCVSGGRFSFRGADIFDEATKEVFVLRLVLDTMEGGVGRFYKDSEFGKSMSLRRKSCKAVAYAAASTRKSATFVTVLRV